MSLVKNSAYNIAGFAIPTLIAIPALGFLARNLGIENFGLFTLAFAIIGYASVFDGGISRAVIREIAIHRNDEDEQRKIISTSGVVISFLSLIASVLLFLISENLVNLLNVSTENKNETIIAFKILAAVIPIFLLNQVWLAYLEGHERFINLNIQKIISNSLIALLPVLFCLYEVSLIYAILGLVVGRYLSFFITLIVCNKIIFGSGLTFHKSIFKRLISFGGWITLSNLISPIMVYFDRFIISNLIGATKVATYTAPAEFTSKLLNVPFALSKALFPKISYANDENERKKLIKLSYLLILIICLPLASFIFFFSEELITLWLGENFKGITVSVLQILLIGFIFNALAQVPYSLLQARGYSRTTALIHVAEIIPYIMILYYLVVNFNILGAAIAWTIRVFFDFILMYCFSKYISI